MSDEPGRTLALDLGRVRIGVALSDPLGITASPLPPVERVGPRKDPARIEALVREHGVERVVVGLPLLLSGARGSAAIEAEEFAETLRARMRDVEVVLWDERLTSVQAERTMIAGGVRRKRRREVVDGLAAVLILQSFLERRSVADAGEGR